MRNPIVEEDLQGIINTSSLPWELLEGKNILITGANGFLSAYMVKTLLFLNETRYKKKTKVLALARNKKRAMECFAYYRERPDLVFIIQDVCRPLSIKEDVHFIIHAASQASPKYFGQDPVGTISANVIGTNNLLTLAFEKKSEGFLFFSSGEVYGEVSKRNMPIKENAFGYLDPTLVRSCYAEGKRAGETMCICWFQQYGVPVKIVRPFHTYGPGMRLDDGRVFADFVSDIVNGRDIIMKSDGSAIRAFCYLVDAITGFFTVLLKGNFAEAYNVGNDEGKISIAELAKILVDILPDKHLKIIRRENEYVPGYIKSKISISVPDTSKIRQLGWRPSYSIKEGFSRTVRSFQSE